MADDGKVAIIVQARMGSTRLPGKVMERIAGRTVLELVLTRCRAVPAAGHVVCATTTKADDDRIAQVAGALGAIVVRGDERDVLGRYVIAAREVDADTVMRVTSDCPLIDPEVCAAVLNLRAAVDADYTANNMPPSWPHGLDCEAFTRNALEAAHAEAEAPEDREHVTPWLRRAPGLKRANLPIGGPSCADQRWTLDTPEDLAFLRSLADAMGDRFATAGWREVLAVLRDRPDIVAINRARREPDRAGPTAAR